MTEPLDAAERTIKGGLDMTSTQAVGARLLVVCRDEADLPFFAETFQRVEGISVMLDRRRRERREMDNPRLAIQRRRGERRGVLTGGTAVLVRVPEN